MKINEILNEHYSSIIKSGDLEDLACLTIAHKTIISHTGKIQSLTELGMNKLFGDDYETKNYLASVKTSNLTMFNAELTTLRMSSTDDIQFRKTLLHNKLSDLEAQHKEIKNG